MRSDTLKKYLIEVHALFHETGKTLPVNFASKNNPANIVWYNLEREEDLPHRQAHLTHDMILEMLERQEKSSQDSIDDAVTDWTLLGSYYGQRLSEFAQDNQTMLGYYETKDGRKKILHAFAIDDFTFYDRQGQKIKNPWLHKTRIYKLRVKWRIKKNRRNGEFIDIIIDENKFGVMPCNGCTKNCGAFHTL